jgi:23S rRNA pseudouridine2605 synthase
MTSTPHDPLYDPGQDGDLDDPSTGERVAKALARAGVASRREVERLIEAGRVAINGKVLTTPAVKIGPATFSRSTASWWPNASPPACSAITSPPG